MFVSPGALKKDRRRFRLPPVVTALAVVMLIGVAAMAEDTPGAAPAGTATAAAPADQPPVVPEVSLFKLFRAGGWFMYTLLACSILAVAIIIERLVVLRRSQVVPRGFLPGLKAVFRDPREDRERALEYCQRHDFPIARMVAAGIRRMPRG